MISIIAAMANERVIGLNGDMPWHMPADLAHFKRLTQGKAIIMGRKTFESLPGALPNRRNIVVSRNLDYKADGCWVCASLEQAIEKAYTEASEVMIVGGAHIYQLALDQASKLYLTHIQADVAGDTFFPKWEKSNWRVVSQSVHDADERNPYNYSFVEYERINVASDLSVSAE